MDLSRVKMVVTDMDGTLLNSNHEVSNRFFELYAALKQRGILFVAASGRQYNSIVDKLGPIKNEIIVIAENGGFDEPIAFWDERLSTAAVERFLIAEADMTRKRRAQVVDKMAAAYILQGALDFLARN
jgi:HAD superfamily hydrolase (TIGR01484 family)